MGFMVCDYITVKITRKNKQEIQLGWKRCTFVYFLCWGNLFTEPAFVVNISHVGADLK